MLIRHIGIVVQDMGHVGHILEDIGFDLIYSEDERGCGHIEKWKYNDFVVELLKSENLNIAVFNKNSVHICFEGSVPDFMKNEYFITKLVPHDPSFEVYLVSIEDNVYFEFARKIK